MKKYLYNLLVLVVLSCTVLLSGCTKDKEVDPAAQVSAKLENGAWNAKLVKAITLNGYVQITATNSTGDVVIINVKAATGTYKLAGTATDVVTYRPLISGTPYISNLCVSNPEGQIVVTEYDATNKTISGTFTAKLCTATASMTMTEGKFNKVTF